MVGSVYRRRNERYSDNCVEESDRFGGGSVLIWVGISLNSQTPAIALKGNLNAQKHILFPVAIPHIINYVKRKTDTNA